MITEALDGWAIWQFVALATVFFFAFAIKGAFGLGSLSPSVLFGSLIIGPHSAVLLALVANIASQAQFVHPGFRDGDWRVFRKIMVANFAGATLGIWIFGWINPAPLMIILGITLGFIAVAEMTGAFSSLAQNHDLTGLLPMSVAAGLAGLISGITGAGGLFLVVVLLRVLDLPPRSFRGTILLMGTLVVGWRFVMMTVVGHITLDILIQVAVLMPFVILGGLIGSRAFIRLEGRQYFSWLQLLILFAAVATFAKGVQSIAGT